MYVVKYTCSRHGGACHMQSCTHYHHAKLNDWNLLLPLLFSVSRLLILEAEEE